MAKKELGKIKTVQDISREFIENYVASCNNIEDIEWIVDKQEELIKENGDRYFFPPFRSEFAKKFYPDLFAKKNKKKKPSMLDSSKARLEELKKAKAEESNK